MTIDMGLLYNFILIWLKKFAGYFKVIFVLLYSHSSLVTILSVSSLFLFIYFPDNDQDEFGRPSCLHILKESKDVTTASHCVVGTTTGWLFLIDIQTCKVINRLSPAPSLSNSIDYHTLSMC